MAGKNGKSNGSRRFPIFVDVSDDPDFDYDDEAPSEPPPSEQSKPARRPRRRQARVLKDGRLQVRQATPDEQKALVPTPLETDVWVYRIPVMALSVVVVGCAVAYVVLALKDKAAPEALVALGSMALGALALLLKPPERRK